MTMRVGTDTMTVKGTTMVFVTAFSAWLADFAEGFSVDVVYTAADIVVAGDIAYETLASRLTLTPRAGGEVVTEDGKGLHIYRRQSDGTWKIALDIWNTDV